MKHNTFEPCKDHESGHFNWCLLCEIQRLREELKLRSEIVESQRENTNALHERMQDIVNCWIKPPVCFSDYDGLADHLKR